MLFQECYLLCINKGCIYFEDVFPEKKIQDPTIRCASVASPPKLQYLLEELRKYRDVVSSSGIYSKSHKISISWTKVVKEDRHTTLSIP
jgi:hypothetical protein